MAKGMFIEMFKGMFKTLQLKHSNFDLSKAFSLFVFSLGIWSVLRVCWLIWSVGGDNISNDYIGVVPVIDESFKGNFNFATLLNDARVGQHFVILPIVFHWVSAHFFDWNARSELFLGVVVNLIRSLLICDLISFSFDRKWRALVLGMVLAIVFSVTHLSVHLFGQACFPVSLTTLGFTLGLWGLAKYQGNWRSAALMLIGGIGSAASMGNVPPCWFAFFLGIVLYGYRKKQWFVYVAWFLGAIISFAPYLNSLVFKSQGLKDSQHAFSPLFFINLLGRPFSNEVGYNCGRIAMAEQAGLIGLLMLAIALVALWARKTYTVSVKSSLLLCAYGLSSVVMLSVVRTLVAPWYGTFATYFWMGLIGLLLSSVLSVEVSSDKSVDFLSGRLKLRQISSGKFWSSAALACLLMLPIFYMLSNKSWTDKHAYMYTRAPASESALRHYRTAPTYIESLLFQWGDGRTGLVESFARPLDRHLLSSFAPNQTWSLQGDFVLPEVKVTNFEASPAVRWIQDTAVSKTVSWSNYEHSNLYIPTPNAVSWQIALPDDLKSAKLHSAFTIGRAGRKSVGTITDGATGQIYLVENGKSKILLAKSLCSKPLQWLALDADLTKWRGQTVNLLFTSDGGSDRSDDLCLFQYPVVEVKLERRRGHFPQPVLDQKGSIQVPVNTDLDKNFGADFVDEFALPPIASFASKPFTLATPASVNALDDQNNLHFESRRFEFKNPLSLQKYSHFVVDMSAPLALRKRSLAALLTFKDGTVKGFSIPLLPDANMHRYSYELKLLELEQNSTVKELILYPVANPGNSDPQSGVFVKSISLAKTKNDPVFEQLK